MVFHVKNTYTYNRIVTKMMVSLFIISTLLFFLVQLSPVSAQDEVASSLTGVIYDVGVDSDDDGYFDYLTLGIEVNITRPATYKVDVGGLYNSTYAFVGMFTEKSMYLDVGIHVIDLALNGTEIYASGVDPAIIADINLYNETDGVIDSLFDTSMSKQYYSDEFQRPIVVIEFTEIKRDIILDQIGSVLVTNSYYLTNLEFQASEVDIAFPEGAYGFEVRDEMGALATSTENNLMTLTFREAVETKGTETIYVNYRMPRNMLISQQNGVDYNLQFTFYEQFYSIVGKLTVSITLPKGAELQSSSPESDITTKSDVQETLTFAFSDVTSSQDLNFSINYRYLVFWGSLYPTIWVGIIAVVASAVFFFWGTPKAISVPKIQVQPKDIKSFVDAYEEKEAIRSEVQALEEQLQNGKIPRRRYKIRRKMLDGRLSAVSRNLSSISETIRAAGSKYANMLRQIEVAEAKLEGAEKDIQRIKARYSRGEVSKGAYGKLLEDYQSRIEDAEATIDGVLLGLRD